MSIVAINAKQPEEIRVAVLTTSSKNKKEIANLYIESVFQNASLKDIYAGVVRSITPGTGAAFIEYGPERHGFLPFRDIAPEYRHHSDRQDAKAMLKVGQSIIVQVTKEERDEKGAMLTTYLSLPGTYLVLMPNRESGGGISKQIDSNARIGIRKNMHQLAKQLALPHNMSVILRTAGAERSLEDLKEDLSVLLNQWEAIQKAFTEKKPPFLIFQEVDILARTVRDYVRQDSTEIIVDDPTVFEKVKFYAKEIRPDILDKIRLYKGRTPLFLHLDIEDEVESAFQRVVRLPSGGSIIFGRAEAGTSIDINSGSATKYADIHETALKTNLEAAAVIAKQLRLRDIGGLILIDFISMREDAHRQQVEAKLRETVQEDRARIQTSDILPQFDVLVMSRQRLRPQLGKTNEDLCATCEGSGVVRSIESLALSIIRAVENRFFLKGAKQLKIEGSVELVTYLGNEKRALIYDLEKEHQAKLTLVPNPYWDIAKYKVTELSHGSLAEESIAQASYRLITENSKDFGLAKKQAKSQGPSVERFAKAIANNALISKLGFVGKLFSKLTGWKEEKAKAPLPSNHHNRRNTKPRRMVQQGPINLKTKSTSRNAPSVGLSQRPASEAVKASDAFTTKNTQTKSLGTKGRAERTVYPKQSIPPKLDQTLLAQSSEALTSPANLVEGTLKTPLANPQPFKRGSINYYGGEPSVQYRGYHMAEKN